MTIFSIKRWPPAAGTPGGINSRSRKDELLSSLADIARKFGLGLFAIGIAAVTMTIVVHFLLLQPGGWTGPIA